MTNNELFVLQQRFQQQQKALRRLTLAFVASVLLFAGFLTSSFRERDDYRIIRAKGIVIVDDEGRERILIGAPLPEARNRVRTDTARVRALWADDFPNPDQYMGWYKNYNHQSNGILILDEQGFDKVALGDGTPDPNIGRRVGKLSGLVFCDDNGSERGGLGIIDMGERKKRVVLALDGENGMDATGISVLENGEAGFFSSGPGGYNMFLGSAAAGTYGSEPLFGTVINRQERNLYKLNMMAIGDTIKQK